MRAKVAAAVREFLEKDHELLRRDVSERTVCQAFANALRHQFTDWDVDCEYNRSGDSVKRLRYTSGANTEMNLRNVVPDIIVHRRGTDENLLAIEVKKNTNSETDEKDVRKLKAFSEQLGYLHTLFLRFESGSGKADLICENWVTGGGHNFR